MKDDDRVEEIPIEEFENDTQNVLEEYRKKFPEDDYDEEE